MKKLYVKIFLLFFFVLQLYLPVKLNAQCLCSAGVPATAIAQSITIAPTTTSTLNFTFNQFDPTVGTLSCITMTDTVTGISYSGARNTNIGNDTTGGHGSYKIDSTNFLFSLSLLSKITAPGINVNHAFNTTYGYDELAGKDTVLHLAGDTITYGPTNFVTNPTNTVNIGGNSAYLGTGTVNVVYAINGGMITLDGGANYKSSVATTIGGTIYLTYYYCPLSILATNLQNFTALRKDNNVILNWDAQNAEEIDQYEIEYSTDGKTFTSIGQVAANHSASAASYSYNYALSGNNSGEVYFRIKQTSNSNKTGYSAIQKINLNSKSNTGIAIHPNPAVTGITLTFDHLLTGDYTVDLVNTAGQIVLNKKVQMSASNTIPVNWTNKPAPGIYFTRVTNTNSMEQQIIRVLIQ